VIEWEVDHFKRLASLREGRGFLERSTARFEGETGTVEPCDVLTPERQIRTAQAEVSIAGARASLDRLTRTDPPGSRALRSRS
jgi:hypothetical protein